MNKILRPLSVRRSVNMCVTAVRLRHLQGHINRWVGEKLPQHSLILHRCAVEIFYWSWSSLFPVHMLCKLRTNVKLAGSSFDLRTEMVLGQRRRRYPSREAFVASLHQRTRDDWRGCPSSPPLQDGGQTPTKSAGPAPLISPEAHVEFGPL
jgi:hypothetical protein